MMKQLPSYIDAEQSVLGSVFLDSKKLVDIMDKLHIEDFFDLRHQTIYRAMILASEENIVVDYTSVISKLEQGNEIHKAGGVPYILDLSIHVPSTSGLESYINLVLDASLKREIIKVTSELTNIGFKENINAHDYVTMAEEKIFAVGQKRSSSEFTRISEVLVEIKEKLESDQNRSGGVTGLRTGFSHVDRVTNGLQPEELLILAARPSMGKSALALNLAVNIAKRNKAGKAGVAVFSLEMSNDQLVNRMISLEADIDGNKIRSNRLDSRDWANFHAGNQILSELNIVFDDSAAVSVSDIRAKCRKLSQEGNLDFVVIDYLQLIKGDSRSGNRQEEVARISRSLKQMARELKVPVLALSQLSRAVETRDDKRPVLADLRESGSIEQDADIVMFLYREDYYIRDEDKKNGDVELIIAKNRQGQSGVTLGFKFEPPYSRFITREDRYEED